MLPRQRQVIAIGLLVLAVILHLTLCEWFVGGQTRSTRSPNFQIVQHRIIGWQNQGQGIRHWGLYTRFGVDFTPGVIFGVALPLALLMLDAYLIIGWRHAARITQRRCTKCGYDMRGVNDSTPDAKCPECGTAVARAA